MIGTASVHGNARACGIGARRGLGHVTTLFGTSMPAITTYRGCQASSNHIRGCTILCQAQTTNSGTNKTCISLTTSTSKRVCFLEARLQGARSVVSRSLVRVFATGNEKGDNAENTQNENMTSEEDEEARLEAFEARLRSSSSTSSSTQRQKKRASSSQERGGRAEWKKGSMFPEGWDDMDPVEKATELYLGERGILYWSTQLTVWGLVLLVVAWVGFRFLGPSLGLYALDNDPNL